ncbi:tripartite tricarboxylate transporter TctB family protein [Mailhella massiliensis]|uniref:Tripartite tricarboxylate transporter TctB family protein n=1 Tax=Mailhella massiliensis TaxID=1903261 RepID=A0A921DQT9_9BACT|nr:tripartite tricarboxylate transporter TctB family protein [Mailhella massiliensis]HJD96874.1 tripartite tricarboxylate transporter TctB family protein [Mailhella massiliensis]
MLKRGNILVGGIFLLIGLCLLKVAMEPHEMLFADPNAMHIMTYPKILISIWIGASVFYIVGQKDEYDWYDFKKARVQLLKVLLCIVVYIFAFDYAGLFGSTLLFLLIFFWVMGYRNKLTIPAAVALALLTWLSFEKLLGIPMPRPFFLDLL